MGNTFFSGRRASRTLLLGGVLFCALFAGCRQHPSRPPVPAAPAVAAKSSAADNRAVDGLRLYLGYCFICHGQSGWGDGPYAKTLSVRPVNLADPDYFAGKTDRELHDVVSRGGVSHGKSIHMRPLGMQLTYEQIDNLVAYIRVLNRGVPVELEQKAGRTAKEIYGMSCVMCHGEYGDGDGEIARKLGITIRPLGGIEVQQIGDADLRKIIADGIQDATRPNARYMPAWHESLTGAQIDELLRLVRSLKNP